MALHGLGFVKIPSLDALIPKPTLIPKHPAVTSDKVYTADAALARSLDRQRASRQAEYRAILFDELGVADAVSEAPSSRKWTIVYEAMARRGYSYQRDFPQWQQLCDPVREVDWDRIECFRRLVRSKLREEYSPMAAYATVGIAAFVGSALLSHLRRKKKNR